LISFGTPTIIFDPPVRFGRSSSIGLWIRDKSNQKDWRLEIARPGSRQPVLADRPGRAGGD
jgi:hypothetical protein